MTSFITWNKTDDSAFRAYYLSTTGEQIQDEPTDLGDKFEVGSSRLSDDEITALLQFSGVSVSDSPSAIITE